MTKHNLISLEFSKNLLINTIEVDGIQILLPKALYPCFHHGGHNQQDAENNRRDQAGL